MRNLTLVLLICLTAAGSALAAELQPFTASYVLSRYGVEFGEVQRSVTAMADGRFEFKSVSQATGLLAKIRDDHIEERSLFLLRDGLPQPLDYAYHRTGGKERHVELNFDWQAARVTNMIGDDHWQMDIPNGTQDKLGFQLAIMLDLRRGATRFSYQVADGGSLKTYQFEQLGSEQVETELGMLETVKVRYTRAHNPNRVNVLWFAPALGYLPVRIEQVEPDGDRLQLHIRSFQQES